jgi:hypothetical protein
MLFSIAFSLEKGYTNICAFNLGAIEYVSKFAVLGGEVAVPCTRNPL